MASALGQTDAGSLLEQQRRNAPPQRPAQTIPELTLPSISTPTLPPSSGEQTTVKQFVLHGNTLLETASLQNLLQAWRDKPVGLAELRQATAALEQHYRDQGWLASASLPKQDVTEGEVSIDIVEAKFGVVHLQMADPQHPVRDSELNRLQAQLAAQLPSGQPLNLFALERALVLADELPGVQSSGSLRASDTLGVTDLWIQLTPGKTLQTDVSADNGGSRSTGEARLNLQMTVNAPWGYGEQLNVSATKTLGSTYVRTAASVPIGQQGWRVGANISALQYKVLDSANITTGAPPQGTSQTWGVEAQYPLVKTPLSSFMLSIGYEEKRLHNEGDNQVSGRMETTNRARLRNSNVGVNGSHYDLLGGGGANALSLVLTQGLLALNGSPDTYINSDMQTARTQGRFNKIRFYASRSQTLTPTLSLFASGAGQWASTNLESAEKFFLGGMNGVRAYPTGEAGGSLGQMLSLELRAQIDPQWLLSGFYDWGQVQLYANNSRTDDKAPLVGTNTVALQGYGASLGWRAANGMSVRGTWAHRLGSNPLHTSTGTDSDGSLRKHRFWLTANLPF